MHVRVLRSRDDSVLAWKNGLGVSRVIASHPDGAGHGAMDWQVSTTSIGSRCPFPSLPGLERQFMLLEGDGVELYCRGANGDPNECRVLGGPVSHRFATALDNSPPLPEDYAMERVQHAPSESQAIRQRIRRGEITGHTSGLAPGCVQGNVVILPQAVIAEARPELCLTHAPGSMLVTDLKDSQLAIF